MPGLVGLFGVFYIAMQSADDNSIVVIITCQQLHPLIELLALQAPVQLTCIVVVVAVAVVVVNSS